MPIVKLATAAACVLLAGSMSACAKPEAAEVDTAKIAEIVKADFTQLLADFNAKDIDKAVSHDAPDYVGMFHGAPNVKGPTEDAALTKLQVSDPNVKLAAAAAAVNVSEAGNTAVVLSTYDYTFTDPATKAAKTEHGNWVLGYKKQADGAYKIAWAVVSDTPAPAAPAPAAQ